MYFAEKIENGKVYYRTDPNGKWKEMTYKQLVSKYECLQNEYTDYRIKHVELVEFVEEVCKVNKLKDLGII